MLVPSNQIVMVEAILGTATYDKIGPASFRIRGGPTNTMILKNWSSPGTNFLMRTGPARLFALLILAFFGVSFEAVAASGPFAVTLDGNITHIASGFSFPNKVGQFQRVMTRQDDTAGPGVLVGYAKHPPRLVRAHYLCSRGG